MDINSRKLKDVAIFDIEGDFRRIEIEGMTLHEMVKEQLDQGNLNILLNFANVTSIDSFCVGEIVSSYISIDNRQGKLLRANTPGKIQIIFEVTGLERVLPNHKSIESALASLRNPNHNSGE